VAVVCDTAVLIAAERRDRCVAALARVSAETGVELVVPAACVAQAWRDGARQAGLARFLAGCVEQPLDPAAARGAGRLLGVAAARDVVDASVAAAAAPGDVVLTGDPADLVPLLAATRLPGVRVERFS
jgi:CBS domain-containing protein